MLETKTQFRIICDNCNEEMPWTDTPGENIIAEIEEIMKQNKWERIPKQDGRVISSYDYCASCLKARKGSH